MVTPPSKRPASRSPDFERARKRPVPSSPEEGELDDPSPPPAKPLTPPQPVSSRPTISKSKVPFPFKKKADTTRDVTNGPSADTPAATGAVPDRFQDDEWRVRDRERESDSKRRFNRAGDHWEPTYSRGIERDDRYHASQPRRSHRDRDKNRSPVLGQASPRSRSPETPVSGPHHEKHRLPQPRSPDPAFSPISRRDYDRFSERHRDDSWRTREDDDDRRFRNRADDPDRYYRPRDEREWTWRDDDRRHERRREHAHDAARNRYGDFYRPPSPQIPPFLNLSPPRSPRPAPSPSPHPSDEVPYIPPPLDKGSPFPHPATEPPFIPPPPSDMSNVLPPPPPTSPPPPPPPLSESTAKNAALPQVHATVSITMKRPRAVHSPPHNPLSFEPPSKPLHPTHQPEDKPHHRSQEKSKDHHHAYPPPLPKKPVVRRTPKEEFELYGRHLVGCGQQSDYDLTTKLGEGTFGEVHKAIHKKTGNIVALKRILMHNEKEGMPVTALREIKFLKALKHPCVVEVLDMFVVRSTQKDPLSVYMVFPYMDHDLAGLLENERVKLQPSHIKLYMKQLLEGTEYMHRNHILHRDMKAANLLISNTGSLKIGDLGLARSFDPNVTRGGLDARGRERKYTNCVVTRWYRPPELLLGARQYGGEVDIWGIGCVFGEMFSRRPILPGTSDLDQLEKIWQLCGTPNQHTWPNFDALPGCDGVKRFTNYARRVKQAYESVGPETADLLDRLLICNPRERITAAQALEHDYFWTDPLPADPKSLPIYEASHEFDKRGHRNYQAAHPPPPQLPNPTLDQLGPPKHFNRNGPQPPNFYGGGPPPNPPPPYPPHGGPLHGPGYPHPHAHGHGHPGYPPPGMHHDRRNNRPPGGYRGGGNRDPREPPRNPLPKLPPHLPQKPVQPQGFHDRPPPPGGYRGGGGTNVQLNYG